MIKKLRIKTVPVPNNPALCKYEGMDNESLFDKINELVDAVNSIVSVQEKLIDSRFVVETKHTEPDGDDAIQEVIHADYYAEQKKWIGKLCRFWNFNKNDGEFNILISLNKESKPLTFVSRDVCEYTHCEPVSPDDDIIYKKD